MIDKGFYPDSEIVLTNEAREGEEESSLEIYAKYLLAAFPFEDLTDEIKTQIFLIGKSRAGGLAKISKETAQLQEAFLNRHDPDFVRADWLSPLAVAYSGFVEKFREIVSRTSAENEMTSESVEGFLAEIDREAEALLKELKPTKENTKFVQDLRDHSHDLIGKAVFDKAAYEDFLSQLGGEERPVVPFLLRGRNSEVDFSEGARALVDMQRSTDQVVVGEKDIAVEFPGHSEEFKLRPGYFAWVTAQIPPEYFGQQFPDFNPRLQAEAAARALIRNNIAALTWLKNPVERSTLGQLGGELVVPTFDPRSMQFNSDGSAAIRMALYNRNASRDLVFDGKIEQPMFRLFVDPSRGLLTDGDLLTVAEKIIGSSFDPAIHIVRQGRQGIALRIPITEYAVQNSNPGEEINVSDFLSGRGLSNKRETLDSRLGITDWRDRIQKVSGISTVIGQTPSVVFPSDVTGVISRRLLVENRQGVSSIARHGGSRVIDPNFSLPVRTEFVTRSGEGVEIGKQYLVVYLYPSVKK